MNYFTEAQIRVIRDLAGFYWDEVVIQFTFPPDYKGKEKYIQDIIKGLQEPEVWG